MRAPGPVSAIPEVIETGRHVEGAGPELHGIGQGYRLALAHRRDALLLGGAGGYIQGAPDHEAMPVVQVEQRVLPRHFDVRQPRNDCRQRPLRYGTNEDAVRQGGQQGRG